MSKPEGASFLHTFDLGNRDVLNPGSNILSVTSTANGDFDKANLTTESVRNVWRSADISTFQDIIIEAEQESQIDTFAILGHNFTPEAVVKLEANISNNFIAPPLSLTLPITKRNIISTSNLGVTFSHYRVRILDPANTCGFVEVGRIVGGRAFTMLNNEDINDDINVDTNDQADTIKSEGYFRVSNENVKSRNLAIKFSKIQTLPPNDINFLGLRNLFDLVGITKPFLTIVDRNNPGFINIWGQLTKVPSEAFTINQFVSLGMRIEEVF